MNECICAREGQQETPEVMRTGGTAFAVGRFLVLTLDVLYSFEDLKQAGSVPPFLNNDSQPGQGAGNAEWEKMTQGLVAHRGKKGFV